jgi:hypothetical protein
MEETEDKIGRRAVQKKLKVDMTRVRKEWQESEKLIYWASL